MGHYAKSIHFKESLKKIAKTGGYPQKENRGQKI